MYFNRMLNKLKNKYYNKLTYLIKELKLLNLK